MDPPEGPFGRVCHAGHWTGLARLLERGLFDGLFLADVLGVYDVHGGTPDAALRHAVQVPLLDPLLLVPAMAAVTQHLGFGVTVNLAYEQPFTFARRMSTLDQLSGGRIGWNIVTGYLDSAARAMGFAAQMAHDDRYDLADEFMAAVYALWERSWDDGAVRREPGCFTDPAAVRRVRHEGANTASTPCTWSRPRRSAPPCCIRPAAATAAAPSPAAMRSACSSTAAASPESPAWWPTCAPAPRPARSACSSARRP